MIMKDRDKAENRDNIRIVSSMSKPSIEKP